MSYDTARTRIIMFSLALTGALLPFLFLGPALGYPLSPPQAGQMISVIVPVFLSYLGAAVAYVFKPGGETLPTAGPQTRPLLGMLINGGFIVFTLSLASLLVAFGYSNRLSAPPHSGMEFSDFAAGITVILGILTSTVGASMVYLFGMRPETAPQPAVGAGPAPGTNP